MPIETLTLRTDRRALSQIVLNLSYNAIKFTEEGGVRISLRRPGPGRVEIAVADTGPGIRVEDQARLFAAFTQVDSANRREGSGLGLHLARKLAELLGGELEVQSEHGKGSIFMLTLVES